MGKAKNATDRKGAEAVRLAVARLSTVQSHLDRAVASLPGIEAAVFLDLGDSSEGLSAGNRVESERLRAIGRVWFEPASASAAGVAAAAALVQRSRFCLWSIGSCCVLAKDMGRAVLVAALAPDVRLSDVKKLSDALSIPAGTVVDADAVIGSLSEYAAIGRAACRVDADSAEVVHYGRMGTERGRTWSDYEAIGGEALCIEACRWLRDPSADQTSTSSKILAASLGGERHTTHWLRMPFSPSLLVGLSTDRLAHRDDLAQHALALAHDVLRDAIGLMLADGLETQLEPFPETAEEFESLQAEIRRLDDDDLLGRLVIGGFANHPIGEGEDRMRCAECIYYLTSKRWCDLPELPVPVEPDWFCRLWRM